MDVKFREEYLNKFLETAIERHKIYIKKEDGENQPWTDDSIFQEFFFCNVFRQYDKCSKWIIEKILPYDRWDLIVLYRFISTHDVFTDLELLKIPLDDLEQVYNHLDKMYKNDLKIFNGCFIRNTKIGEEWTQAYKVPFYLIKKIKDSYSNFNTFLKANTSLKGTVEELKSFPGVGGFMAYEYACDFEYTNYFNPIDKYTWANKGPGATRGMSWLLYGKEDVNLTQEKWLHYALELYPIIQKEFKKEFPKEDLTMREVEHWLCEFQKYMKYLRMKQTGQKVKHRKYVK